MKAEKSDGDYYIYLTESDIHRLSIGSIDSLGHYTGSYKPVFLDVTGDVQEPEEMMLMFSRRSDEIRGPKANDGIYFEREELGPTVKVYPPVIAPLLNGGHAVTRYDGYEKKIWFKRDWAGELEEGEATYLPQG